MAGERVPSFALLVPGPWRDARDLVRVLSAAGIDAHARTDEPLSPGRVEIELVEDDALGQALAFGRSGRLPDALLARIDATGRAAIVDVALRLDRDHARVAALGRALRDAGGLAVRMELSGAASEWEPWLARIGSGSIAAIYQCAVVIVGGPGELFTCGMHHFDRPDAEIAIDDPHAGIAWLDAFHVYQLIEDPVLAPGHTFRPDEGSTRRTIERWPDARHARGDGRHNPFGLWRFLPEGAPPRSVARLALTITPPLVTLLAARERQLSRPLGRDEVLAIVGDSPAIALERSHARDLERSRGYADIDPELAWEQWQIVRATQ